MKRFLEALNNYNELLMLVATIVMTAATIVMMYSGCQQTRIADSLQRMSEAEEYAKLVSAKKELRDAAFKVMMAYGPLGGIHKMQTKEQCVDEAKKIYDLMSGAQANYYLLSNPAAAQEWEKLTTKFSLFVIPDLITGPYHPTDGTNIQPLRVRTDEEVIKMFRTITEPVLPGVAAVYDKLALRELINAPTKANESK